MSKVNKIIEMTSSGVKAAEIAKKLKTSVAYVYFVRSKSKKKKSDTSKKKAVFKSPRSRLINDLFQMRKAMDVIESKKDVVNHPPHYKSGGVETIDFIEAKDLNYRLGNVVKYVSRAGKKESDPIEDLKKALWYLNREITVREKA